MLTNYNLAYIEPLMPVVIHFLKRFPNYLEVLVQCARKVEVSLWRHLFDVAGPPRALFDVSHPHALMTLMLIQ
jgi:hypothetical protein